MTSSRESNLSGLNVLSHKLRKYEIVFSLSHLVATNVLIFTTAKTERDVVSQSSLRNVCILQQCRVIFQNFHFFFYGKSSRKTRDFVLWSPLAYSIISCYFYELILFIYIFFYYCRDSDHRNSERWIQI